VAQRQAAHGNGAQPIRLCAKQAKNNSVNENFQTVSGVGKKAFYFQSEIFNRIEVLVDTRFFHVDGASLTLDQAESLARKVLAKS